MLELLKKTENNEPTNKGYFTTSTDKHFPSSVREWNNSIFLYNKNNLSLIPCSSKQVMNIIKGFFNMFNQKLEKKLRSKRLLLRLRRLSSNRIYLSNGEFKHTNNKVLINIYLFNRQIHNYLSKLKNIYIKKLLNKKGINKNIIRKLRLINKKSIDYVKKINKNKYLILNILNIIEKNRKYRLNTFKSVSKYINIFYKKIFRLTMKKLRLYFIYKQLIYINRSKLNYNFLHILKKHLENMYSKNVEFNLINLNRFYLNSDILFESVKLKLTRNKRKMRKILNKIKAKVEVLEKSIFLKDTFNNNEELKILNKSIQLKETIFWNTKHKYVTGFRLETRGRLSRRYTASRSLYKLKYRGNLLHLDSSFKNVSSVILKGNLESNLQYSKLTSKTRIGSFGIKGWVSSN